MVWLFERDGDCLRSEIRREQGESPYHLAITYPDRSERHEAFRDPRQLLDRSMEVHGALCEEGWKGAEENLSKISLMMARRPPGCPRVAREYRRSGSLA